MSIIDESINKLNLIQQNIEKFKNKKSSPPHVICVSKTFPISRLMPLIKSGHKHFGENKVQEAESKWQGIKKENPDLKLHMIGKLQSNKAKKAVDLFDYVHSLDSKKLAQALNKAEDNLNKKLSYFIQVNIGSENQKSGVLINEIEDLVKFCSQETKLNIIGLMVLPPNDGESEKYFEIVSKLNLDLRFKELSMGMSSDYTSALKFNSTFLRIGSAILGDRNSTNN